MKGKVTASRLNVRSSPGLNGGKIGLLNQETLVEVLDEHGEWLEIKFNGDIGFVHSDFVMLIDAPLILKGRVKATRLNVRDRPDVHGEKIGSLIRDTTVDILAEHGEWLEISFNDDIAFVHGDFVELLESNAPMQGRVTANLLNVRSEPRRGARALGQLTGDSVVTLSAKVEDWYEIQFNDSIAYIHGNYVDVLGEKEETPILPEEPPVIAPDDQQDTILETTPLAPDVKLPLTGTKTQKKVARTWNAFGGLLQTLSGAFDIETGCAIAVLCVESSGKGFEPTNQDRMIIRFENHLFWKYWGRQNPTEFRQHFQYGEKENGKLKVWKGHKWRDNVDDAWKRFHGNQAKEWQVLEFARGFDDTAALYSISMGAPQIMGFNHKTVGYKKVQEMFADFSQDIRKQIQGLFDFFDKDMIKALQDRDFFTFAGLYNGSGQKEKYGGWIHDHYDAFNKMTLT